MPSTYDQNQITWDAPPGPTNTTEPSERYVEQPPDRTELRAIVPPAGLKTEAGDLIARDEAGRLYVVGRPLPEGGSIQTIVGVSTGEGGIALDTGSGIMVSSKASGADLVANTAGLSNEEKLQIQVSDLYDILQKTRTMLSMVADERNQLRKEVVSQLSIPSAEIGSAVFFQGRGMILSDWRAIRYSDRREEYILTLLASEPVATVAPIQGNARPSPEGWAFMNDTLSAITSALGIPPDFIRTAPLTEPPDDKPKEPVNYQRLYVDEPEGEVQQALAAQDSPAAAPDDDDDFWAIPFR